MNRIHQVVLIISTLLGSWLGMQQVHELGHVVAAWLTGGRVARVVLSPLTISRTDLAENPRPLIVVWGGPVIGIALPLTVWMTARAMSLRGAFVLRFYAGFCLIANGAYLGTGTFNHVGDAGEMLRRGSDRWHLWLFGVLVVPAGLWLWHGLGPQFGLGKPGRAVDRGVVYATLICCLACLAIGFAVGG